jgi:hypothetical protein
MRGLQHLQHEWLDCGCYYDPMWSLRLQHPISSSVMTAVLTKGIYSYGIKHPHIIPMRFIRVSINIEKLARKIKGQGVVNFNVPNEFHTDNFAYVFFYVKYIGKMNRIEYVSNMNTNENPLNCGLET